jgi:hypothetical protein
MFQPVCCELIMHFFHGEHRVAFFNGQGCQLERVILP